MSYASVFVLWMVLLAWPSWAWPAQIIRGPILQNYANVASEAELRIWTDMAIRACVDYGPSPLLTMQICDSNPVTDHRLRLTGLTPGAPHSYRIVSDGAVLESPADFEALRSPGDAGERSYVIIADFRWPQAGTLAHLARMATLNPKAVLTAGDNGYYLLDSQSDFDARLMRPFRELWKRAWAFVGAGNHDNSTIFKGIFPSIYRITDGDLTIIHLTSWGGLARDIQTIERLRQWLAEPARWRVIIHHHPAFVCGYPGEETYAAAIRAAWVPIYEAAGVDLVISGHEHLYARSGPKNGVTYVITGGGSDGLSPVYETCKASYTVGRKVSQFGWLHVEGDTLEWRAIGATGEILDAVQLIKGSEPPAAPTIVFRHELGWTTERAARCILNGQAVPTSGQQQVPPGSHRLLCEGPGGQTSRTTTIGEAEP